MRGWGSLRPHLGMRRRCLRCCLLLICCLRRPWSTPRLQAWPGSCGSLSCLVQRPIWLFGLNGQGFALCPWTLAQLGPLHSLHLLPRACWAWTLQSVHRFDVACRWQGVAAAGAPQPRVNVAGFAVPCGQSVGQSLRAWPQRCPRQGPFQRPEQGWTRSAKRWPGQGSRRWTRAGSYRFQSSQTKIWVYQSKNRDWLFFAALSL